MFVDDLPGNLKPARALGMATVVHRGDAAATLDEVSGLLRSACADRHDARERQRPPTSCERETRSASSMRASTTVTAG